MDPLPGKFVWFEHLSADTGAARSFYERLLGWHVEMMPIGDDRYPLIMNGSDGIGGFVAAKSGEAPQWRGFLSVLDVDHSHRTALAAGAKSLQGPTEFGVVGRGATIVDPTGAVISLWKSTQGDRPDVPQAPPGQWCWNELWTADPRRALAFYEAAFGYGHETMDMGEQGSYYMLAKGGQSRGGIMRSDAPAQWVPYVAVADADATTAQAQALGGRTMVPPTDIPGIGRFSVLIDPQGATFAVIKLIPAQA
ncbi:VOC family protein [Aquincola sp. S2]|uniref:VOC family protein n=1 Tax=Pseudaquabacterium terrae TaxID=2732868 RepID=A0ABX2EL16_9BURK|nr:VOC family protein [Aquabacterium terrae]NRF69333.1 VOC family protein [Aquabacterium terrae]